MREGLIFERNFFEAIFSKMASSNLVLQNFLKFSFRKLQNSKPSIENISERERNFLKTTEAFYLESADLNMVNGFAKMSAIWEDISNKMPDDMDAMAFNALFKVAISKNDTERPSRVNPRESEKPPIAMTFKPSVC